MIKIIIDKETDKMYLPFFKINNRLNIFLPNPEHRILDEYSSRIENITETGMSIAAPMPKGVPLILRENETFAASMPIAGAAYEFSCVYFDKALDSVAVWRVSLPYNISKNQQRQFVRYDISIPVNLEVIEQRKDKDVGKIFFLKTKDISAGGFKIISRVPFETDALVLLTFEIPLYGEITVSARVIRTEKPQKDLSVFWTVLQFVEISPKERDAIVHFIFKKQLEERRKMINGISRK